MAFEDRHQAAELEQTWIRGQGGDATKGLAHGAHVEGAHEHRLLDSEVVVVVAPIADQFAHVVQVVSGVAAEAFDAAVPPATKRS
ncbi:MAG: hypothetical protein ACYDA0_15795 [Candidatus Dormibacteraceae bacterium]